MLAAIYGGRTLVLMRQFETEEWMKKDTSIWQGAPMI